MKELQITSSCKYEKCKTAKDVQFRVAYFVKKNLFGRLKAKEPQRNEFVQAKFDSIS